MVFLPLNTLSMLPLTRWLPTTCTLFFFFMFYRGRVPFFSVALTVDVAAYYEALDEIYGEEENHRSTRRRRVLSDTRSGLGFSPVDTACETEEGCVIKIGVALLQPSLFTVLVLRTLYILLSGSKK